MRLTNEQVFGAVFGSVANLVIMGSANKFSWIGSLTGLVLFLGFCTVYNYAKDKINTKA